MSETIVACASPWGRAAISVVRLSGIRAREIAASVCPGGPKWVARRASLRSVQGQDGTPLDEALVVWMPGPHSYTGEDIVEISGHGNPVLVNALIDVLIAAGARPARPGEFTRRALENGRTDVLRAEALAALIEARSLAGVQLARQGLDGGASAWVGEIRERILDLAAELEARLDHPDDELATADDADVCTAIQQMQSQLKDIASGWSKTRVAIHGATIAIVGPVNAGKSSLFNHLVGTKRALVSPTPGTTRDVVERAVDIGGLSVCFLDTAGEGGTDDPLEQAGVELGRSLTDDVDFTLVVLPLHQALSDAAQDVLRRTEHRPRLLVGSHADLDPHPNAPTVDLKLDTRSGEGVQGVFDALRSVLQTEQGSGARAVALSQRQHGLCVAVADHLSDAGAALTGSAGPAVAAEALVCALECLGDLAGTTARESVLDRLFARFCIGK